MMAQGTCSGVEGTKETCLFQQALALHQSSEKDNNPIPPFSPRRSRQSSSINVVPRKHWLDVHPSKGKVNLWDAAASDDSLNADVNRDISRFTVHSHYGSGPFLPEPTPIGTSGIQIVDSLPMSSSPLRNEPRLIKDLYQLMGGHQQKQPQAKRLTASICREQLRDFRPFHTVDHLSKEDLAPNIGTKQNFLLDTLNKCERTFETFRHDNADSNVNSDAVSFPDQPDGLFALTSLNTSRDRSSDRNHHGAVYNSTEKIDGPASHATSPRGTAYDRLTAITATSPCAEVAATTQSEQWNLKFQELLRFKNQFGNCLVPNSWKNNPPLAHWVRRQRHQYRRKKERKHSTLSDKRQQILEQVGFVWDSHRSVWDERLEELVAFREDSGHCRVPRPYKQNPALAIWVKCQRRQYQLAQCGRKSSLTSERMNRLERLGFVWYARGHAAAAAAVGCNGSAKMRHK